MCKQCEKKPVYEFTNKRKLCGNCFIRYFNKKVLYTIRKFELIKKSDVVGYKNKRDFRGVVLEEVLKMFSQKAMIELVKSPSRKKLTSLAIESTIDLESDKIINVLFKKNLSKKQDFSPIEKKQGKIIIKPLYLFLDKEVLLYAKLKKLKFKKEKNLKQDKISEFINLLEKKHPEVKRAILNSYLKLFYN